MSRRHQTLSHAIKDAAAHPRGAGDGRGGLRRGWGRIWRAPCRPTTPSWRCAEGEDVTMHNDDDDDNDIKQ